jgi:hypothetical protein
MKQALITVGVFMAAMLFIAGCTSESVLVGTVIPSDGLEPELKAPVVRVPDIAFTTNTGKRTSLSKVSKAIEIVAFTTHGDAKCGALEPPVLALLNQLDHLSITVVQVSVPTEKCSYAADCMPVAAPRVRFVTLCDDDRIAWKAYGEPSPNTVFLIGETRRVESVANLDNLSAFSWDAERLGQEVEARKPLAQGP